MSTSKDWNLSNLPPEGHADVGPFFWELFTLAENERDRLKLPEVWDANHRLWRGNRWGAKANNNTVSLQLFFANVQRTVANITARNPVAECVDLDGTAEDQDKVASAKLKKWWKDTEQRAKLLRTCQQNEIYGITIEKAYWSARDKNPDILVCDPYACFPAPGYWEDIAKDPPYFCHAYPEPTAGVEKTFSLKPGTVEPSDTYSLLGEYRETNTPITSGSRDGAGNHHSNYYAAVHPSKTQSDNSEDRALVVEVWVRDNSTRKDGLPIYPDGIRKVTLTNEGKQVCDDVRNPNINWELNEQAQRRSFLFGRYPFYKANSYEDATSIWGFSAADQVSDLLKHLDEIMTKLVGWVKRCMMPIMVIPPGSGITRRMLSNKPGLVLYPDTHEAAGGIRYLQPPALPAYFFQIMEFLINLFDRTYAIQDADRGNAPSGVIAASAIVALQERNQVLIQHKINNIDYLVEQRGNCAMSLLQNHGHKVESIEVEGDRVDFSGVGLAGYNFNYVVESGSTMPKTSLQVQEQAVELAREGFIDAQALLETINFPNWKKIIERQGEDQLGAAMQILVQAGLPEQEAAYIVEILSQPQGGPGDTEQKTPPKQQTAPSVPQPGTPRAMQGQVM